MLTNLDLNNIHTYVQWIEIRDSRYHTWFHVSGSLSAWLSYHSLCLRPVFFIFQSAQILAVNRSFQVYLFSFQSHNQAEFGSPGLDSKFSGACLLSSLNKTDLPLCPTMKARSWGHTVLTWRLPWWPYEWSWRGEVPRGRESGLQKMIRVRWWWCGADRMISQNTKYLQHSSL